MLLAGVSWYQDAFQISEILFWIEKFTGAQFMIIFRKFFQRIVDTNFSHLDAVDAKIASLYDSIYLTYPFISVQKKFGYSDVTEMNNGSKRIEFLIYKK